MYILLTNLKNHIHSKYFIIKGNKVFLQDIETYPKIFPGGLANQSILIIRIKIQNPVISNNRYDGKEGWNIEFDLKLA